MADKSKILSIYDELQLPLGDVRRSYLVKFVDENKEYPCSYSIQQDGTKIKGNFMLKGCDLTEPQILELFLKELL